MCKAYSGNRYYEDTIWSVFLPKLSPRGFWDYYDCFRQIQEVLWPFSVTLRYIDRGAHNWYAGTHARQQSEMRTVTCAAVNVGLYNGSTPLAPPCWRSQRASSNNFEWSQKLDYQTLTPGTHLSTSLRKLCAPLSIYIYIYICCTVGGACDLRFSLTYLHCS